VSLEAHLVQISFESHKKIGYFRKKKESVFQLACLISESQTGKFGV